MFTAQVPPVDYRAPWDIGFSERMAMLTRGSPRAAYFYETPDTSTFRYRVYNVARTLAAQPPGGPSAAWFDRDELDRMDHVLELCDVLVLCRTRYSDAIARLVARARALGRRVLFDSDDLVFDPAYAHLILDTLGADLGDMAVWDSWFAYVGRMAAAFQLCDAAVVTNGSLAACARAAFADSRPALVVPNFLERRQQAVSDRVWAAKEASGWARDGRIHLGYFSGTPTHNRDFALVAASIARLMDEDRRIVLRVAGFLDPGPELARHGTRVERMPLQDHLNLQRLIGEVEVNLVPLQDNVFTNCKSELKWFEAAVVGALTVATPTRPYREAIAHGETGWLAASQHWDEVVREVVADVDARRGVATRARDVVRERYGWDGQADAIAAALFAS